MKIFLDKKNCNIIKLKKIVPFRDNKKIILHGLIFTILSFKLFVITPVAFINKSLVVIACIGVLLHLKNIKFAYSRWYEIVLFITTNSYLTFAIFGYDLFLINNLHSGPLYNFFIFGLGFLWTSYVLQSALDALKSLGDIKNRFGFSSNEKYWVKWLILFAIMFSVFMIWQRSYNPIVMSPDSWRYIAGWLNGTYDSGSSPVYAFLISLVCNFAPTKPEVAWIAVTQIFAFSLLLATILMYFHKKWIRFRYIIPVTVILPLIPSLGLHTIVVWTDLTCGMSILWLTYILVRIFDEVIIHETVSKKQQISLCLQLCISMVLLYFIRLNSFSVYLVVTPVLALLFTLKKEWKFLAIVLLSVVMVLLIRFPGYDALQVVKNPSAEYHRYYAAIHDIQATYYGGGELSEQTLAMLRKRILKIDDPELRNHFTPDWVQYYSRERGYHYDLEGLTMSEFISMYTDSIIHNPSKMIKSMLFRVRSYWVIDPKAPINCVNRTTIYDRSTGSYSTQASGIGVFRQPNFLTSIMDKYLVFMNNSFLATFIWRFGFWTSLMVISIMTLILRKKYIWLLTYLPIFVYIATLFLTSGWTDYRYGLPVFFVGMFLPSMIVLLNPADTEPNKINMEESDSL